MGCAAARHSGRSWTGLVDPGDPRNSPAPVGAASRTNGCSKLGDRFGPGVAADRNPHPPDVCRLPANAAFTPPLLFSDHFHRVDSQRDLDFLANRSLVALPRAASGSGTRT